MLKTKFVALLSVACVTLIFSRTLAIDTELRRSATWELPSWKAVDAKLMQFLNERPKSATPLPQIVARWEASESTTPGPEIFDVAMATLAIADERIQRLSTDLDATRSQLNISSVAMSATWVEELNPWARSNTRLFIARSLAGERLYDEASEQLALCEPSELVDPSTWLFYTAVCQHHLLQTEECNRSISKLMEREPELATRYAVTARLMRSDLEPFEEDSLDEISRLMKDVERRLALGRSGTVVREQEQKIVDKLDKIIENIEQQLQQQQQQQQQAEQDSQSKEKGKIKPLDDSRVVGGTGPGDVDPKSLKDKGSWGDLPPAQRQEALQNITKDLPSHYREVIESYFKRLATTETP